MPALTLLPTATAAPSTRRRGVLALPRVWLGRVRARNALAVLDPAQVREAGIDPYRLRAEILKPFWRA